MTNDSLQLISQNHQSDNPPSANETASIEAKTGAKENKSKVNNDSSNNQSKKAFRILDHIDKLKPAKGSDCAPRTPQADRYICPVCGGNNLTIEPNTGKYQCWNGCECSDIREAISPWAVRKRDLKSRCAPSACLPQSEIANNNNRPNSCRHKKPRLKSKKPTPPVSIPKSEIVLATLPEKPTNISVVNNSPFIPDWLKKQGVRENATEVKFWYSKNQWVSRFEWKDKNTPKGHSKTYRQGHIKPDGTTKWSKGKDIWQPYKIDEAIANAKGKWLIAVEGEPCVETLRSLLLAGITFQGSNWNNKAIKSGIEKLKDNKIAGLIYLRDNDSAGQEKAQKIAEICNQLKFPYLIIEPTDIWSDMPPKGDIVDWIKAHGGSMNQEEFIGQLELAIHQAVERRKEQLAKIIDSDTDKDKIANIPDWSQSGLANWLAERYRPSLAWNTELQEWYRYGAQTEGIWSKEPVEFIGKVIKAELESLADLYARLHGEEERPKYSINLINSIMALLKLDLAVRKWDESSGLLPLLNGVLDLKTRKLIPHAPGHRLTWCLPYAYNPILTCDPIVDWLTTMCGGDCPSGSGKANRNLVQLMRAYLLGVVTGRTDWQKYLELIGAGGTGKSTFTRLAIALVGANNTHTTTLKKLEGERFETASIADKRLVLINDSERYAGSVSTLKALTGQDTLPYEVKFKQSTGGFTPTAMVIVAANETIQSSDYTSGLERRRVTVPMFNKIPSENQRNLIEHRNGKIIGEFAEYIPGLLNWVLEMDEAEATRIIKNYQDCVPGLAAMKAQTIVESNPIADWLDNNIIYQQNYRTNIGVAQRDKDNASSQWYLNTDRWLYANYAEYCHNTGSRPIGVRRFVNLLSDLCQNQLKLDVEKGRDRYGSYFSGLKIRGESDDEPPLITGELSPPVINPPPQHTTNITWSAVTDTPDSVTDSVTDESIGGDECDGCDGYFKPQSEKLDSQKTTSNDLTAINKENLPSHPSHNIAQSIDGDKSQPIPHPSQHPSPTITSSITSSLKRVQPNDKVRYVGSYYVCYKDRVLTVKTVSNWDGVSCYTDNGEITTWLPFEDLERLAQPGGDSVE